MECNHSKTEQKTSGETGKARDNLLNGKSDTGIDAARMQTEGLGETVPVSDDTSPEGKANN